MTNPKRNAQADRTYRKGSGGKQLIGLYLFLIIGGAFAFSDGPQRAGFYESNSLYNYCGEQKVGFDLGVCVGYVRGAYDAFSVAQGAPGTAKSFCPEQGIPARKLEEIATQYMSEHSAESQSNAISTLKVTFAQAFPCPK